MATEYEKGDGKQTKVLLHGVKNAVVQIEHSEVPLKIYQN